MRTWASPWLAFAAGAVAMLAVVMAWIAWTQLDGSAEAMRAAAENAGALRLPAPHLPQAPQIPDTPVPRPG